MPHSGVEANIEERINSGKTGCDPGGVKGERRTRTSVTECAKSELSLERRAEEGASSSAHASSQ